MNNRFIVETHEQLAHNLEIFIVRDTQTGIRYMLNQRGNAGGITPLLNANGEISISKESVRELKIDEIYLAVIKQRSAYGLSAEILNPSISLYFSKDEAKDIFNTGKIGDTFQVKYIGIDPQNGTDKFTIVHNSYSIEI